MDEDLFTYMWVHKYATSGAKTFDQLIRNYEYALSLLKKMRTSGIKFDAKNSDDGVSWLYTHDPKLAKTLKFEKVEFEDA